MQRKLLGGSKVKALVWKGRRKGVKRPHKICDPSIVIKWIEELLFCVCVSQLFALLMVLSSTSKFNFIKLSIIKLKVILKLFWPAIAFKSRGELSRSFVGYTCSCFCPSF